MRCSYGLPVDRKCLSHAQRLHSLRYMILVTEWHHYATCMVATKHDRTAVIFENLLSFTYWTVAAYATPAGLTANEKYISNETTRTSERIVAERQSQSAALRLIYIPQRVIRIYDLTDPGTDYCLSKVGRIHMLHLDCLLNVIRYV